MRTRTARLIFLKLLTVFLTAQGAFAQGSLNEQVQQAIREKSTDLSWVTDDNRAETINLFKAALQGNGALYNETYVTNSLFALNDSETISYWVNQYHADKGGPAYGVLELQGHEGVVAAMGPDLSLPPSVKATDGDDVIYPPVREYSATILRLSLRRSKDFPTATLAWVNHLNLKSSKEEWEVMNEWWQHNKEAILAHRYADATWLPLSETNAAVDSSDFTEHQTPNKPSPPLATVKILPKDASGDAGWVLAIGSLIILATLGGVFLLFRLVRK